MDDLQNRRQMAAIGSALGDDTRLRLLTTLLDSGTTGFTVTDLAERLSLPQPRISTHLAILHEVGLVERKPSGRARIYRATGDRANPLLDARQAAAGLEAPPPASLLAMKEVVRNSEYRNVRTCYDHLAGLAAVDLLDQFVFDRWLVRSGGADERPTYDPTDDGKQAFARLGVDVDVLNEGRRQVACGCLDWTERRPHLAGALGAAVLDSLQKGGFVERTPGSRRVQLIRNLDEWIARA